MLDFNTGQQQALFNKANISDVFWKEAAVIVEFQLRSEKNVFNKANCNVIRVEFGRKPS